MSIISGFLRLLHKLKSYFCKKISTVRIGKYGSDLHIHGKCKLSKNTFLGNNVNMNGLEVLGAGKVCIGDNFHSGAGCLLITSNHNYDHGTKIPYDSTAICKDIIIEDNVWFGARVIVLGGVHIGEGAIIQAGAVVVSDIDECGIAGGNPARVFKYRDKKHYFDLKEKREFF